MVEDDHEPSDATTAGFLRSQNETLQGESESETELEGSASRREGVAGKRKGGRVGRVGKYMGTRS